jgi:hypothetical protein
MDVNADADERLMDNGLPIPLPDIYTYADQPYMVETDDNAWLCVTTVTAGREGEFGQHIVSMRTADNGRTWTDFTQLEPPDGVESSYAVILKNDFGRIYAFYNHNTDNVRRVKADNPPYKNEYCCRVDSQGYFVFKYSDDNGISWSDKRYNIPSREFEIDRNNADRGKIRYFWNVGKPFAYKGDAYVSLHKVGGFGEGFFTSSEGVLLKSSNIMREKDPGKITWETLPEGDIGLRAPEGGGKVSEEHSCVVLSDGSFYANYRSCDGHPVETYSRDCGRAWSPPQYKKYPNGRLFKHPRSANFVWKCNNGKYLYWFNNHGGKGYEDRNPAWISAGVERDTPDGKIIVWSQPEILLYADDPFIRMSYPDLIEKENFYYISETQKHKARIHKFDGSWFNKMWDFMENKPSVPDDGIELGNNFQMVDINKFTARDFTRPDYGSKRIRNGFSLEFITGEIKKDDILFDTTTPDNAGILVDVTDDYMIRIALGDGRSQNVWRGDRGMINNSGGHICIIVDGGPGIITFVINGKFCDGGEDRQFGFGRFSLIDVNAAKLVKVGSMVKKCRFYKRAVKHFEAQSLSLAAAHEFGVR